MPPYKANGENTLTEALVPGAATYPVNMADLAQIWLAAACKSTWPQNMAGGGFTIKWLAAAEYGGGALKPRWKQCLNVTQNNAATEKCPDYLIIACISALCAMNVYHFRQILSYWITAGSASTAVYRPTILYLVAFQ